MKKLVKIANYLEIKYAIFGFGDRPFDEDIEKLEEIEKKSEGGIFTAADLDSIDKVDADVLNNILAKAVSLGFSFDKENWKAAYNTFVGGPMVPGSSRMEKQAAVRVLLGLVQELISFFQIKNDEA